MKRVLLGGLTILVAWVIQTNQGAHLTEDSRQYMYAAQTWIDSGQMRYWIPPDGYFGDDHYHRVYPPDTPNAAWSPLYPALLAIGSRIGLSFEQVGLGLCLLAVLMLVLVTDRLLDLWTLNPSVHIAAWGCLLMSPMTVWHVSAVRSDLLFAAFTWWFVWGMVANWRVSALIGLAWSLTLLRYVGVSVLPTGAVSLWIMGRKREAVIFALLSPIPLGLILIRNWVETGTLMGIREPSTIAPVLVVQDVGTVFVSWSIHLIIIAGVIYAALALGRRVFHLQF